MLLDHRVAIYVVLHIVWSLLLIYQSLVCSLGIDIRITILLLELHVSNSRLLSQDLTSLVVRIITAVVILGLFAHLMLWLILIAISPPAWVDQGIERLGSLTCESRLVSVKIALAS